MMRRFLHHERGATAIEYSLILGVVAVVIIVSVTNLGTTLDGFFTTVADEMGRPVPGR
jgi:pilus assembly protein Flp/PilA